MISIGFPNVLDFPMIVANSNSKSTLIDELNTISSPFLTCPLGITILVPEATIEEDLPWYAIGMCNQFSIRAFSADRNKRPTFSAWFLLE